MKTFILTEREKKILEKNGFVQLLFPDLPELKEINDQDNLKYWRVVENDWGEKYKEKTIECELEYFKIMKEFYCPGFWTIIEYDRVFIFSSKEEIIKRYGNYIHMIFFIKDPEGKSFKFQTDLVPKYEEEFVTKNGSRFRCFEEAWINSELRMVVKGFPARDEVLQSWERCETI